MKAMFKVLAVALLITSPAYSDSESEGARKNIETADHGDAPLPMPVRSLAPVRDVGQTFGPGPCNVTRPREPGLLESSPFKPEGFDPALELELAKRRR